MTKKINTKPNNPAKPQAKRTNPKILPALSLIFSILACHQYLTNKLIESALLVTATIYTEHRATKAQKPDQNQTINRLKDLLIFTGITLNPNIPTNIGFITLTTIILLPHIAKHIQALSKNRIKPPISRTHIYTILIASTLAEILIKGVLTYSLIIITALTIYSFAHTLTDALKTKKPHNHQNTKKRPNCESLSVSSKA